MGNLPFDFAQVLAPCLCRINVLDDYMYIVVSTVKTDEAWLFQKKPREEQ